MGFLEFGRDALLASRALVLSEGLLIGPPNADRTTRPWAVQFGVCGVGLITIDGKNVRLALYFEQHSNINRIELQSMGDFPIVREAVLTVFGDLPGAAVAECGGCQPLKEKGKADRKEDQKDKAAALIDFDRCVVGYFDGGDHRLPSTIQDSPAGCLDRIGVALRKEKPSLLMVIGRCDMRPLNRATRRSYTENLTLAYQRATTIKDYLFGTKSGSWNSLKEDATPPIILLPAGAAHSGEHVDTKILDQDRVVELVLLWNRPIHPA